MFSPGRYYLRVPRDPKANVAFRMKLLRECGKSAALREDVRHFCAQDLFFYINTFVWQINPKKSICEVGPFVTWGFQERALRRIIGHLFENQDDVLLEKSREQGATWLALILFDWAAMFHPWKKFLCVSHSMDAVDRKGDSDSLFWKIDFMHDRLPNWLIGPVERRGKGGGFIFERTNSAIVGVACSERSGVGGRATAVFLDEFSKQVQDRAILGQTADTGPRLFVGTHYGLDTAFYDLTRRPDMHKILLHWTEHPDKNKGMYQFVASKNQIEVIDKTYAFDPEYRFVREERPTGGPFPGLRSPWYDKECRRRNNQRDVAMHLDIDPEGSVTQFFDPLIVRRLIEAHGCEPFWEGDLVHDPALALPQRLLKRRGGLLKLWMTPTSEDRVPPGPYAIGCDVATGSGATPSCASIVNCRTGEKVAEYADPFIDEQRFAAFAVSLARLFVDESGDGALLAWEVPGAGYAFGRKVLGLDYRHIYYRQNELSAFGRDAADVPGWHNTVTSCRLLLEEYREALKGYAFLNHSIPALEETLKFKYTPNGVEHSGGDPGGDPSGARVNHGDRAMADAIANKMRKERGLTPRPISKDTDAEQVLAESRRQMLTLAGRRELAYSQRQQEWE